jgi:hypothetical protein
MSGRTVHDHDFNLEGGPAGSAACAFAAQGFPAAFALEALDGDDIAAFREHLPTCLTCQVEVAAFGATAAQLPFVVELAEQPSPALRERLLAAIAADTAPEQAPQHAAPEPIALAARRWPPAYAVAAVMLLVLSLGLLGWNLNLQRQMRQTDTELAATRNSLNQTQAALNAARNELAVYKLNPTSGQQATGEVLYLRDRQQAVLVVNDLPPLKPGQVYQIWLIDNGQPTGAGVFITPTTGISGDLARYQTIAITIEPGPTGSTAPTMTPIAAGALSQ